MKVQADCSDECPVCGTIKPPHFLVCRVCSREIPFPLKTRWWGARGLAHAFKANGRDPKSIAAAEEDEHHARLAILSHLKQHGTALIAV